MGCLPMSESLARNKVLAGRCTEGQEKSTRCDVTSNASNHLLHVEQQGAVQRTANQLV